MHQKIFKYLFESGKNPCTYVIFPWHPFQMPKHFRTTYQVSGVAVKLLIFFYLPRKGLAYLCSWLWDAALGKQGFIILVSTPPFSLYNLTYHSILNFKLRRNILDLRSLSYLASHASTFICCTFPGRLTVCLLISFPSFPLQMLWKRHYLTVQRWSFNEK